MRSIRLFSILFAITILVMCTAAAADEADVTSNIQHITDNTPISYNWREKTVPGKIELVSWGWHGSIYYQHVPKTGVSPDYIKKNCIDETWKWGANLLELYPTSFNKDGWWPMPLPKDKIVPGFYPKDDPRWQKNDFLSLAEYLHDHGYLYQWFCHPALVWYEGKNPVIQEDEKGISTYLEAASNLASEYADDLTLDQSALLDGFGYEHWFVDNTGRTASAFWDYNPGLYLYSTHSHPATPSPNYSFSMMNAAHGALRGRDDQHALPAEYGRPLTYQADSRPLRLVHPDWARSTVFSQGTWPDWMLKQAEDLFRRRLTTDEVDSHSIWWLGIAESLLPPELRRYVYIACLDPITHSVCAPLYTTGVGGHIDRMHTSGKFGQQHRSDYQYDTVYIGNNYLRLYQSADSTVAALQFDPSFSQEFDKTGPVQTLSTNLIHFSETEAQCNAKTHDFAFSGYDHETDGYSKSASLSLEPGRYSLVLSNIEAEKASALTLFIDDNYGPGIALKEGEKKENANLDFTINEDKSHKLALHDMLQSKVTWQNARIVKQSSKKHITNTILEPGGYFSRLAVNHNDPKSDRKAGFQVASDFPAIQMDITTDTQSNTILGIKCENISQLDMPTKDSQSKQHKSGSYNTYVITPEDCDFPLVLRVSSDNPEEMRLLEGMPVLTSKQNGITHCTIDLGINCLGMKNEDFATAMAKTFDIIESPSQNVTVDALDCGVDTVRIVKIATDSPKPYAIREMCKDGKYRWVFRGAQRSAEHPDCDYLRVYQLKGSEVEILPYDRLPSGVKWAPGSQNVLAFSDIVVRDDKVSLGARVMDRAPHVFAPGIEFESEIMSAKLDGKDWSYFEGNILRLPQSMGEYRVEVDFTGPAHPHISRTYANVESAVWDGESLKVESTLPPWTKEMPEGLDFTYSIAHGQKIIKGSNDYKKLRTNGAKSIIASNREKLVADFE